MPRPKGALSAKAVDEIERKFNEGKLTEIIIFRIYNTYGKNPEKVIRKIKLLREELPLLGLYPTNHCFLNYWHAYAYLLKEKARGHDQVS